ncbi:MAG: class I tRNA ligase family protein [Myxococcota bacterium]|nr:class I tRNA ligase family protein [Myxococcota bacterium]
MSTAPDPTAARTSKKSRKKGGRPPMDIPSVLGRIPRPARAVVTAGMPYANGPLHIGHLAGAHVPADIHARWVGMLIGRDNVLFVNGTDDHGTGADVAAGQEGLTVQEYISKIHQAQSATLAAFGISVDVYTGTSRAESLSKQTELAHWFLRRLHANGMLEKRTTLQWYDPDVDRFLADRLVRGTCPACGYTDAYADECGRCGHQHEATELIEPRSQLSEATPEQRETVHWFLDMDAVSETLRVWLEGKKRSWRQSVIAETLNTVLPRLRFEKTHEAAVKAVRSDLARHKWQYAKGGGVVLQFGDKGARDAALAVLAAAGVEAEVDNGWAFRSITRDVKWGLPVPEDLDPDLIGKTLYVWPDSLIAPITFTRVALEQAGRDAAEADLFWKDPSAAVYQFLGQDNVFFYVLLQGAMWLGTQEDPHRLPVVGELQMTEVFGCFHLLVEGEKMSKSRGNFVLADELVGARGHDPDQVRYYLALLGLSRKQSNFDFAEFDARNQFLAGPLNAALEKPIAAAHSKFGGRVPDGELDPKVVAETARIVQRYVGAMQKADYPAMLYALENYARTINSQFTQYKPHDDRFDERERRDALATCFMVLKTLMVMLYPFVPSTMDRVRQSLNLPKDVFAVESLGVPIPPGHALGPRLPFFPKYGEHAND